MPPAYLPPLRFSFLTPLYDWVVSWSSAETSFRPALVELAAQGEPRHVLELGCGTGTLTWALARRLPVANVTGIDADHGALHIARQKGDGALRPTFLRGDARSLPEVEPVDVVVASLFFHHLDGDGRQRVLAQIHHVLRPDGRLLIADWGRPRTLRESLRFQSVRMLDGYSRTAAHASGAFVDCVSAAGFSIAECASFSAIAGNVRIWSARRSDYGAVS